MCFLNDVSWDDEHFASYSQNKVLLIIQNLFKQLNFYLANNSKSTRHPKNIIDNKRLMVHIHWASHARYPWSHARLPRFPGNYQCGMHIYTVFFHYIMIVLTKIITISGKNLKNMGAHTLSIWCRTAWSYHCPSDICKMHACLWTRVNSKEVDDKPIFFSDLLMINLIAVDDEPTRWW